MLTLFSHIFIEHLFVVNFVSCCFVVVIVFAFVCLLAICGRAFFILFRNYFTISLSSIGIIVFSAIRLFGYLTARLLSHLASIAFVEVQCVFFTTNIKKIEINSFTVWANVGLVGLQLNTQNCNYKIKRNHQQQQQLHVKWCVSQRMHCAKRA